MKQFTLRRTGREVAVRADQGRMKIVANLDRTTTLTVAFGFTEFSYVFSNQAVGLLLAEVGNAIDEANSLARRKARPKESGHK